MEGGVCCSKEVILALSAEAVVGNEKTVFWSWRVSPQLWQLLPVLLARSLLCEGGGVIGALSLVRDGSDDFRGGGVKGR